MKESTDYKDMTKSGVSSPLTHMKESTDNKEMTKSGVRGSV